MYKLSEPSRAIKALSTSMGYSLKHDKAFACTNFLHFSPESINFN